MPVKKFVFITIPLVLVTALIVGTAAFVVALNAYANTITSIH